LTLKCQERADPSTLPTLAPGDYETGDPDSPDQVACRRGIEMTETPLLLTPPRYCDYAAGPCDQVFGDVSPLNTVFFIYPSIPEQIAVVIETAVQKLGQSRPGWSWKTWKQLPVPGQMVFCEICKAIRHSVAVVADVTTLNFNLLFEIGYTIGLGVPVIPIRDTNLQTDRRAFEELGLLDTLGYVDFRNSNDLHEELLGRLPAAPLAPVPTHEFRETPMYVLKGPVETEGAIQMMSALKKARIYFRTYDPIETPRLSLHEARRQVAGSRSVIANLLEPSRAKALQHNGQSALICGIAMAQQKAVAMVQEGTAAQPIDYRDVVQNYTNPNNIAGLLQPTFNRTVEALQEASQRSSKGSNLLQTIDLGDVAAENEIAGLREYFVVTGQATQAKQGHARLVVGRKGSGKTAVFYDVRNSIGRRHDRLILDLRPEGHQFKKLRELVLDRLGPGLQEHTMVAFWNYILLGELARKALDQDSKIALRDPARYPVYKRLNDTYLQHDPGGDFDFSQRLLMQVDRISRTLGTVPVEKAGAALTQSIYSGDLRELNEAVSDYLKTKEKVWLLVDDLDKGWPVRGTSAIDILIVRSLLDATRKLQHQLEANDVDFECLVFLRSDIYEHLREDTPDKGKDTAIRLDWEDPEVFAEIIHRRAESSGELKGSFREMWPHICVPLINGQDSFTYMIERTLMRPRDLLQFLRAAMHIAINRGHSRIEEDDLLQAERSYSEDLLLATTFEIANTYPDYADLLYAFDDSPSAMSVEDARDRLMFLGEVPEEQVNRVLELLIWFGFLGVASSPQAQEKYSFDVQGNLRRLLYPLNTGDARIVIHPAFRSALQVQ
jgi:hypothetical protein